MLFPELATPSLLLDVERLDANIAAMQALCDAAGTELRPHIKTHKMVEIARRQLRAGAAGLTCAKLSEAEAMLPAFEGKPASIFLAHSLADVRQAPRLRRLAGALDELILGCTSPLHAQVLEQIVAAAGLTLPVMLAVDTGLGREGARDLQSALELARCIAEQPHLKLHGIYTHEGHLYGAAPGEQESAVLQTHRHLVAIRSAVADALNLPGLQLWPGSSVSAARMAGLDGVDAVRPGAYVCGDLSLMETTQVMAWDNLALTVLATVCDRPLPGLALLDAGSKVFSSDKTPDGSSARAFDRSGLTVFRCNEEHGYARGDAVDKLAVGARVRLVPAHVCTTINLANSVAVVRGAQVVDCWNVDARGCVQ